MALTKVSTGMLSADAASVDLNIDAGTMFIDASANRVGVGNTSPATALDVTGTVTADGLTVDGNGKFTGTATGATPSTAGNKVVIDDTENGISILSSTSGAGYLIFGDSGDNDIGMIIYDHSANALRTYVNAAERMRIDSSGRVLIGSGTSPSSSDVKHLVSSSTGAFSQYSYNGGAGGVVGSGVASTLNFYTYTGNIGSETYTERMRIDSSGNVGIGTASPSLASGWSRAVHVNGSSSGAQIQFTDSTTGATNTDGLLVGQYQANSYFINRESGFQAFYTANIERLRIDSSGHLLINNTAFSTLGTVVVQQTADSKGIAIIDSAAQNTFFIENQGDECKIRNNSANPITFSQNVGERMRIDASGVLIIGAPGGNSTGIIQGSSGAGSTNQPGTDLQLKGGSGGGTGGSKIKFFTAPGGSSGTAESAAVERMYIDEAGVAHFNGDVKVLSGDIQMGNGRGINFTASSNASGMTSETLDDYEEGTYTAAVTAASGTITLNTAQDTLQYTKVGRLVHIQGTLVVNSVSSPSGELRVSLPFAAGAGTELSGNSRGNGVAYLNGTGTPDGATYYQVAVFGSSSSSVAVIYGFGNSSGFDASSADWVAANAEFYFSYTYETA